MPSKVTGNNCELLDCIRRVRLSSDGRFRDFHHILLCVWRKLGLKWYPFALKTTATTKKWNARKAAEALWALPRGSGNWEGASEKAHLIWWTRCGRHVAGFWFAGLFSVEHFSSCSFPFPNISHLLLPLLHSCFPMGFFFLIFFPLCFF